MRRRSLSAPAAFIALATAALLAFPLASASAASAGEPAPVPSDIQAVFDTQAVEWIVSDASSSHDRSAESLTRATSVSEVHEQYRFAPEARDSGETHIPFVTTDQWMGAILAGSTPVGTVTVWRGADGSTAQVAGYGSDPDLGAALAAVGTGTFVYDERTGEAFVVRGGSIAALNRRATAVLPDPQKLSEFAAILAARSATGASAGEGINAPVGGGEPAADRRPWFYGINPPATLLGGVLLIGGLALATLMVVRRRRRGAYVVTRGVSGSGSSGTGGAPADQRRRPAQPDGLVVTVTLPSGEGADTRESSS